VRGQGSFRWLASRGISRPSTASIGAVHYIYVEDILLGEGDFGEEVLMQFCVVEEV
jgi:hypothetical protein